MKRNFRTIAVILSSVTLFFSGCGSNTNDQAYATAYLDYEIKGITKDYAELSGQDALELEDRYQQHLADFTGFTFDASDPTEPIPPELLQDYSRLQKEIFQKTDYKITKVKRHKDSCDLTVKSRKMNLFQPSADLMTEKWNTYLKENTQNTPESSEILHLKFLTESWNEILEHVTYQKPETSTWTMTMDKDKHLTLSSKDLAAFQSLLFDQADVSSDTIAESSQSVGEGAPDPSVPENINHMDTKKAGEPFYFKKDGTDIVSFTLDSVQTTTERSEFVSPEPENVIVISYTYKNLASDDPVLFDDMRFHVLEGDTICEPYYMDSLISTEPAYKAGDSVSCTLPYAVTGNCKEVTIIVTEPWTKTSVKVTVPVTD